MEKWREAEAGIRHVFSLLEAPKQKALLLLPEPRLAHRLPLSHNLWTLFLIMFLLPVG